MPTKSALEDLNAHMLETVNAAINIMTFGNDEVATGQLAREAQHNQPRYRHIVVAYDGSEGAQRALEWAKDLGHSHGATVIVASVYAHPTITSPTAMGYGWYPSYIETYAGLENSTRKCADDAVESLRESNVDAKAHAVEGSVVREISRIAREEHADLVIVGASKASRATRAFLGTVATGLLDHAPCSVLIARGQPRPPRILVGTDGSHVGYRAVAHAFHRASATGAELIVEHVMDYPEEDVSDLPREGLLKAVAHRMQFANGPPKVRYVLDVGRPATRILLRSGEEDAGLVVVGAQGKGVVERLFVGSTSRRVANESHASVLIIKQNVIS